MKHEKNESLTLVGSGIKSLSHLTMEAKTYITQSEKVLYLVNEPLLQSWITENNTRAESLDNLYTKFPKRIDCYRAITDYILQTLRTKCHVCVVIYGHPCVFARPGLEAIKQAEKEGFDACILPGISADACLFADLKIDPGTHGVQSFEATDFLVHQRVVSITSNLLLWQVGALGHLGHGDNQRYAKNLMVLQTYLLRFYPEKQPVYVYEAAQYPHATPVIQTYTLDTLHHANISRIATLYLPSAKDAVCDDAMLAALGLTEVECAT